MVPVDERLIFVAEGNLIRIDKFVQRDLTSLIGWFLQESAS